MGTKIYELKTDSKTIELLQQQTLTYLGLQEVRDLESWLASCKDRIFDRDILWIARQDTPADNQRSDIIGLSKDGDLIIVELKRGRVGVEGLSQVLSYAAEYRSKTADELAKLYHEQSQKVGPTSIVDVGLSFDAAEEKLNEHIASEEINQSQVLLVVAESFDDKALAVCDFLEESISGATFSIELWQYGVYQKVNVAKDGERFFLLEQIAPPPSVRSRVENERVAEKDRKRTRDVKRTDFVVALRDFLKVTNYPLKKAQGQSYAGEISLLNNIVTFQVRRNDPHPWLGVPHSLKWENDSAKEVSNIVSGDGGDHWWIEFTDVDGNNLEFKESFGKRLVEVLSSLHANDL